jgi:hypothetical protein
MLLRLTIELLSGCLKNNIDCNLNTAFSCKEGRLAIFHSLAD